ncbi:MAG TPA: after-VIT domain-containing protein, partial [Allocoleopsis sp.]
ERGGHFAVYLIPAVQYAASQIVPKDVVFLIDTSGSQMGAPLRQCQELMRGLINGLHADDTFSIIDFSDTTQQLSTVPLTNTPAHRSQAMQYIDHLHAGGGTEMLRGIRAVLNFPITDPNRLRSIVLLTDGYIGNENQILAEVQRYLQPEVRLYSFGAGSSVNRFLLNRIAEMGRGAACIMRSDEPTDAAVATFFRQINNPVLTNIQVQWQGEGEAPIFYPALPPDLFADQPLVLFGRKADRLPGNLQISGRAAGKQYQQTFALSFDPAGNPAIAQLWGRARIKQLMNQMVSGETKIGVEAVTDTALSYQLLSPYTAFVAVSDQIRVNPTEGSISVQVPVEMPENISYAGIFGSVAHAAPMARMAPTTLSAPMPPTAAPPGQMVPRRAKLAAPLPPPIAPAAPPASFDQQQDAVQREQQPAAPVPEYASLPSQERYLAQPESEALQLIQVTGLDEKSIELKSIELLMQRLRSTQLPSGLKGDVVFELQVSRQRVRQVILDEQATTLLDQPTIDTIRLLLFTWNLPQTVTGLVRIHLRLQS